MQSQASVASSSSRGNRGWGNRLTVAGHRPRENNYRIDGVSINDYTNGSPGSAGGANLGADAIAEFSVLQSSYSADYGRTSGGVINGITRSGSNAFSRQRIRVRPQRRDGRAQLFQSRARRQARFQPPSIWRFGRRPHHPQEY